MYSKQVEYKGSVVFFGDVLCIYLSKDRTIDIHFYESILEYDFDGDMLSLLNGDYLNYKVKNGQLEG